MSIRPDRLEINCGSPGSIPNGWIENLHLGTSLGTSIIYRCNKNMKRIGASSATCEKSGRWSYNPPMCLCKSSYKLSPSFRNFFTNWKLENSLVHRARRGTRGGPECIGRIIGTSRRELDAGMHRFVRAGPWIGHFYLQQRNVERHPEMRTRCISLQSIRSVVVVIR